MLFFPSTEELDALGFDKKPDHHFEYDNWVRQVSLRKSFRIVKRRKPIYSWPDIRIQLLDKHQIVDIPFIGCFTSFDFFKSLLIGVRCIETDGLAGYFPSNSELHDMSFVEHYRCDPKYIKCWQRPVLSSGHVNLRISININEVCIELVTMDGHSLWIWFKGFLPSRDFFLELINSFHSLYDTPI